MICGNFGVSLPLKMGTSQNFGDFWPFWHILQILNPMVNYEICYKNSKFTIQFRTFNFLTQKLQNRVSFCLDPMVNYVWYFRFIEIRQKMPSNWLSPKIRGWGRPISSKTGNYTNLISFFVKSTNSISSFVRSLNPRI